VSPSVEFKRLKHEFFRYMVAAVRLDSCPGWSSTFRESDKPTKSS